MEWYKKVSNLFKRKTADTQYGGFELLRRIFGSQWSKGGMLEQYEKSLYVFRCVEKIAEKVASTDMRLFQILNSQGDTKEVVNNPLLDLLFRPNPFQTRTELIKITITNLKLSGDAYWFKVRNNSGRVVELWNLRPDYIEILRDPVNFIRGYRFTKSDGTQEIFAPEDVVHFKKPTPLDEYYGMSPIKPSQTRIDTEALASTYQRDFFLNNGRPDAILKTQNILTQDSKDQLREQFNERHQGIGKNSKLAIFDGGLEYQQISISQREMDFIESMKFTRDDILVAFGVPKPVVGITEDVNLANAETGMYIFLSETVKPELESFYEQINEMLVIPDFGDNLFADFVDPTPEIREQTLKEYENGTKNGWLLINEIRQRENLPPVDGGDTLYLPINMVPVGGLTQAQKSARDEFISKQTKQSERLKARIFRGRKTLKTKFLIAEELVKDLKNVKTVKSYKKIKTKKVKGSLIGLIKGDEMRQKYADFVNIKIDKRSKKLVKELEKLAEKQRTAIIAKLKRRGDLTKAVGKNTKRAVDSFYKSQASVWAEFAFPFIEEYAKEAGQDALDIVVPGQEFVLSKRIQSVLKARAELFGLGVNETTRDKVTRAISDGIEAGEGITKISDRISEVYNEFGTYRSDLIARTESTASTNEGFVEAYKQSKVATHKEWVNAGDARVRDEHQDGIGVGGEIVPVDKTFSNGLAYPQEPNCRCVLAPAFEE